jgi:hypothetical protein
MRNLLSNYNFFVIFFLSSPFLSVLEFPKVILLFLAFIMSIPFVKLDLFSKQKLPVAILIVYFISILILVYWYKSGHFILYFLGFFMAFFLVSTLNLFRINEYIDKMSNLSLFMLVGSFIGLIFYFFGFGHIYRFTNPNGDENLFYFLTLSNAKSGLFIRPSGFFAEPGYFGFIVSVVVFLRQLYGKNPNISLLLIVLTLITQSIVFFLFAAFWVFDYLGTRSIGLKSIFQRYILALVSIFAIIIGVNLDFFDWFQERVVGFLDEDLFNARAIAWYDLLEKVKSQPLSGIIFGFDLECIFRTEYCFTYGGVPLVPLLYGGLMYSWPYYLFIIFLLYLSFHRSSVRFSSIGLIFTTFSQPALLELPYSLIYIFLFHSIFMAKDFNFFQSSSKKEILS